MIFVEESFENSDHQIDHVNQIIIRHEDNSLGRYFHISPNSSRVVSDNLVNRGDTIALSGETGFVDRPLLQFDVLNCLSCPEATTIPVGFANAEPPVKEEMISYLANRTNMYIDTKSKIIGHRKWITEIGQICLLC